MVVISISLTGKELADFDHLVEHYGYDSRSGAVRDALHQYVIQHRFKFSEGQMDIVLTLVYGSGSEQDKVRSALHDREDLIRTNFHNHLGEQCYDVLVVHGKGVEVHELIDALTSMRGVRVNVTLVSGDGPEEGRSGHSHGKATSPARGH